MPTLFPSILPNSDEPFVDNKYSRQELERMDYATELKPLAAEHESEAVNGSASREEIINALEGEKRV